MEYSIISSKFIVLIGCVLSLLACSEKAAGTDVETQIDPIVTPDDPLDTTIVKPTPSFKIVGSKGALKNEKVHFFERDYFFQDSINEIIVLETDSNGNIFLPDSTDFSNKNLYYLDSLNYSSLLIAVDSIKDSVQVSKTKTFLISVESEFIYGGGEADSAYFYIQGSPLSIQCGLEKKLFEFLPKEITRIDVINKNLDKLSYKLPADLPDSLEMVLKEQVLILKLDTLVELISE